MSCHGNHAFSNNPNQFIYLDNFVLHLGSPLMNNLAPVINCPGGAR